MRFEHTTSMRATVDRKAKKNGLEVDEKHFKGMKPGETKIVDHDAYIYGIEKDGSRYVKLVTGWHRFGESK